MSERPDLPDDPLEALDILWYEALPDEVLQEATEQVKEEADGDSLTPND